MTTISRIAERQAQLHQNLKETLLNSGYSYRELSGSVNPDNLEANSRVSFHALRQSLKELTSPRQLVKSRSHDVGYGFG
jgi:hypothetical protein